MDRKENDQHRYDDIINLPHHVSAVHPRMSDSNRAAQFAPFAALTGYEDAISETGRLTDQRIELDEDRRMLLDERLQMIMQKDKAFFIIKMGIGMKANSKQVNQSVFT